MRKQRLSILALGVGMSVFMCVGKASVAEAATFSQYWTQDSNGVWKVKDGNGNLIKNCWLCDDAVKENGKDVWYLLDTNGNMISAGLVKDAVGNYYSLETSHDGYYGMLRYKSGQYDGISLSLEDKHEGRFAAINNNEGIESLKGKYGVMDISNISTECVYTSNFGGSSTAEGSGTKNLTQQRWEEFFSSGKSNEKTEVDELITDTSRVQSGDTSGYKPMH